MERLRDITLNHFAIELDVIKHIDSESLIGGKNVESKEGYSIQSPSSSCKNTNVKLTLWVMGVHSKHDG